MMLPMAKPQDAPFRPASPSIAGVVTWDYTPIMIANVRNAKARLSELLDRAAKGEEVIITSDGRPKAKLVAVRPHLPFRVNRSLLRRRTRPGSPAAEALVRAERDSRD